jgi:hypothetical protein
MEKLLQAGVQPEDQPMSDPIIEPAIEMAVDFPHPKKPARFIFSKPDIKGMTYTEGKLLGNKRRKAFDVEKTEITIPKLKDLEPEQYKNINILRNLNFTTNKIEKVKKDYEDYKRHEKESTDNKPMTLETYLQTFFPSQSENLIPKLIPKRNEFNVARLKKYVIKTKFPRSIEFKATLPYISNDELFCCAVRSMYGIEAAGGWVKANSFDKNMMPTQIGNTKDSFLYGNFTVKYSTVSKISFTTRDINAKNYQRRAVMDYDKNYFASKETTNTTPKIFVFWRLGVKYIGYLGTSGFFVDTPETFAACLTVTEGNATYNPNKVNRTQPRPIYIKSNDKTFLTELIYTSDTNSMPEGHNIIVTKTTPGKTPYFYFSGDTNPLVDCGASFQFPVEWDICVTVTFDSTKIVDESQGAASPDNAFMVPDCWTLANISELPFWLFATMSFGDASSVFSKIANPIFHRLELTFFYKLWKSLRTLFKKTSSLGVKYMPISKLWKLYDSIAEVETLLRVLTENLISKEVVASLRTLFDQIKSPKTAQFFGIDFQLLSKTISGFIDAALTGNDVDDSLHHILTYFNGLSFGLYPELYYKRPVEVIDQDKLMLVASKIETMFERKKITADVSKEKLDRIRRTIQTLYEQKQDKLMAIFDEQSDLKESRTYYTKDEYERELKRISDLKEYVLNESMLLTQDLKMIEYYVSLGAPVKVSEFNQFILDLSTLSRPYVEDAISWGEGGESESTASTYAKKKKSKQERVIVPQESSIVPLSLRGTHRRLPKARAPRREQYTENE